jgi:DNA-binding NtrC family response regulator
MDKLKILVLEDLTADADLINKCLERNGMKYEATIATSKTELIKALAETEFDIVLGDHSSASMEALTITREQDRNIPFILVSGMMAEEEAINIMHKENADDYILIDHMKRLPTAIRQAIKHRLTKLGKELCEAKLLEKSIAGTLFLNS